MPADHGTSNTGDERDREVEAMAEAIRDTYVALGTRSGLFGSVGLLDERSRRRLAEVFLDRRAVEDLKAELRSPSRDGTVAVEDVAQVTRELRGLWLTGAGPQTCAQLADRLDAALAKFGVSERTERIHDQATKEEHERRH